MRLMILTADYPPHCWSGIGAAVELQARALARRGVEVHVMLGHASSRNQNAGHPRDPQLHWINSSSFPLDPRGFDRIHLHSLSLGELALELNRRFGLPITYTAHSLLWQELEPSHETVAWVRWQQMVMRSSQKILFLSQSERQEALRILPDLADRSIVIGNAVEPPPVLQSGTGSGPIVFAGRFVLNKGLDLLVDLLPRLLRRRSESVVLAGGHGDARATQWIAQIVKALGVRCHIAGWLGRPQLQALFQRASMVLVPSRYEPFGLVALEAMRMGAPVVASNLGGLAEIVTAESGGLLASAHSADAWEEKATTLLDSPTLWRSLHERGPSYVAHRFQPAHLAARLLQEAYA